MCHQRDISPEGRVDKSKDDISNDEARAAQSKGAAQNEGAKTAENEGACQIWDPLKGNGSSPHHRFRVNVDILLRMPESINLTEVCL